MADTLRRLRKEHGNIARLLNVMERELALFDQDAQPDYEVLEGIADYFAGFPERCHHPTENLVLDRLRRRDPEAAAAVGDLEGEHRKIGELAGEFRAALRNVLMDAEVPRSAFDAVARRFITEQRRHMEMEESRFFPLAEDRLTAEDWEAVAAAEQREADPLFEAKTAKGFEALYDAILRWEREDEGARR